MRDPLSAYLRDYDASSPEAIASIERAKAEQRRERAHALLEAFTQDSRLFDRLFKDFACDDPGFLQYFTAHYAAEHHTRRAR